MPNWYPIIRPGDREYIFDLPIRIRHFYKSQPRSIRDDYPVGWPVGGITEYTFENQGTGYLTGDEIVVIGGNSDALARILADQFGRAVAFDWISRGSGYSTGLTETTGGSGTGLIFLVDEVA